MNQDLDTLISKLFDNYQDIVSEKAIQNIEKVEEEISSAESVTFAQKSSKCLIF